MIFNRINRIVKLAICLILIFLSTNIQSQTHLIAGIVRDRETREPLPFVNVVIKNTTIGTITDTAGIFKLKTTTDEANLVISALGYHAQEYYIQNGANQQVLIDLMPDNIALNEITVKPDDGPVRQLLRQMVDNKSKNNPEKHNRYAYNKYARWEYRINNVGDKLMQSRLFSGATNVFGHDKDSTRFMPVYFSEQVVYNEFQRDPLKQKSTILADKTSGLGLLQDTEISGFTSGLDVGVNFYNNTIELMSQNFISPAANNGWFYYQYYLMDSVMVNQHKHYTIKFTPKRLGDNTFTGLMTIEDQYFSIVDVDADLTNTAHLNFVKSLRMSASYQMINDSLPFFKSNEVVATIDYLPVNLQKDKKRVEILASNSSVFQDVSINPMDDVHLSYKRQSYESIKQRGAFDRDSVYWAGIRPMALSKAEKSFVAAIDSVNQLPFIKFLDNVGQMTLTGYWDVGKWELGPYDYMLKFNKLEGTHIYMGGRTSSEISENVMLWGGIGYGTRNENWLGRLGVGYKLPTSRRNVIKLEYCDDINVIGENEKILFLYENKQNTSESNLVSHVFKRNTLDELFEQHKMTASMENEWRTGFSSKLSTSWMHQYSPEFYPFTQYGMPISGFEALDLGLNFRWAAKEKYLDQGFRRIYLGTKRPIINLSVGGGQTTVKDATNYYGRVHLSFNHNVFMGQTWLNYVFEGGMLFGKLPYPLLDMPRANETYGFYLYNFNMMNNLEFVHDKYLHTYIDYHLNGFFFKRLPLIKHLGLREVITAKAMLGTVDDKHRSLLDFPTSISTQNNNPYAEIGVGAENIFRFFRVDALWRVTPGDDMAKFGVRASLEIKF